MRTEFAMSALLLSCTNRGTVKVISLVSPGRMVPPVSTRLENALASAADDGRGTYILDLAKMTYVDSAGLEALIAFHQWILERGGSLLLSSISESLKQMLELCPHQFTFAHDSVA